MRGATCLGNRQGKADKCENQKGLSLVEPEDNEDHYARLRFSLWLRLNHFINLCCIFLIMRSGLLIMADHPKLMAVAIAFLCLMTIGLFHRPPSTAALTSEASGSRRSGTGPHPAPGSGRQRSRVHVIGTPAPWLTADQPCIQSYFTVCSCVPGSHFMRTYKRNTHQTAITKY